MTRERAVGRTHAWKSRRRAEPHPLDILRALARKAIRLAGGQIPAHLRGPAVIHPAGDMTAIAGAD